MQQSALVDCDFSYEQKDLQSLELKWYFRHDPTPIYTWIPPKKPQVHPTFKNHINIEYEISSDPYLKHRALNLQDLSTKLSGRYSCRVSSIFKDDFKSRDLIIYGEKTRKIRKLWKNTQITQTLRKMQSRGCEFRYKNFELFCVTCAFYNFPFLAPARKTSLMIGWVTSKELNITCEAKDIYPEPNITIKIDGLHFANERYVTLIYRFYCLETIISMVKSHLSLETKAKNIVSRG